MKDGSEEKMMPLFWLHWLHAPSLAKKAETEFLFLVTVTLTLITNNWVAIPSCVLM